MTANVCNSLRLTTCTVSSSPKTAFTSLANGFPLYPPSHKMLFTSVNSSLFCLKASNAPFLSLLLAAVMARACGNPCVSTAMCRFIPDIFLPASYPFPSALSVFLTLCASTIRKLLLQDLRPCFIRASPINFF